MKTGRALRSLLLTAAVVLVASCSPKGDGGATEQRIVNAAKDSDNWLTHGRDYAETRHSTLTQINTETVGQLGIAWFQQGGQTPEVRLAMLAGLLHDLGEMYIDPMHGEAETERELDTLSYRQIGRAHV